MKPKGHSDTVAARFAARLFTICCTRFLKARWQIMNNLGQHAGVIGAVISLLAVEPDARYIIETSSGRDVEVLDHELQIIAA
jgi:uncharacterized membrane protein